MPYRISPDEANALLKQGYTYVDVRTEEEFEACHPAGAVNIPLMHETPQGKVMNSRFAEAFDATFPAGSKVILGCAGGNRSLRAAAVLSAQGRDDLYECRSGFDGSRDPAGKVIEAGWRAAGLPCEEGQPEDRCWEAIRKKLG